MSARRESRNLEYSIRYFITECLKDDNWSDIDVKKTFNESYRALKDDKTKKNAIICVRTPNKTLTRKEIGNNAKRKFYTVEIDIFAKSDGIKLDLSDWMEDVLENGCSYFETGTSEDADGNYELTEQLKSGHIEVQSITVSNIDLGINADKLDKHRRLLTLICTIG